MIDDGEAGCINGLEGELALDVTTVASATVAGATVAGATVAGATVAGATVAGAVVVTVCAGSDTVSSTSDLALADATVPLLSDADVGSDLLRRDTMLPELMLFSIAA
jgi:hypothetical protein